MSRTVFTINSKNPEIICDDYKLINSKIQMDYHQNMVKKIELFLKQSKEFLEPIEKQLSDESLNLNDLNYSNRLEEMLVILNKH